VPIAEGAAAECDAGERRPSFDPRCLSRAPSRSRALRASEETPKSVTFGRNRRRPVQAGVRLGTRAVRATPRLYSDGGRFAIGADESTQDAPETLGDVPALQRLAQDFPDPDRARTLVQLCATVAAHQHDRDGGLQQTNLMGEIGADELGHRLI